MSENLICPLRFNFDNNECISNCAWHSGSEDRPQCAILKISHCLTSIDKNNGGFTVVDTE